MVMTMDLIYTKSLKAQGNSKLHCPWKPRGSPGWWGRWGDGLAVGNTPLASCFLFQ